MHGRQDRGRHLEKEDTGGAARDKVCPSCKQREMDEEEKQQEVEKRASHSCAGCNKAKVVQWAWGGPTSCLYLLA